MSMPRRFLGTVLRYFMGCGWGFYKQGLLVCVWGEDTCGGVFSGTVSGKAIYLFLPVPCSLKGVAM